MCTRAEYRARKLANGLEGELNHERFARDFLSSADHLVHHEVGGVSGSIRRARGICGGGGGCAGGSGAVEAPGAAARRGRARVNVSNKMNCVADAFGYGNLGLGRESA